MKAVAEYTLVGLEYSVVFFAHRLSGFLRRGQRIVHDFRLTTALCNVRVLMEQAPRIARHDKVAVHPLERKLVTQSEEEVAKFHRA